MFQLPRISFNPLALNRLPFQHERMSGAETLSWFQWRLQLITTRLNHPVPGSMQFPCSPLLKLHHFFTDAWLRWSERRDCKRHFYPPLWLSCRLFPLASADRGSSSHSFERKPCLCCKASLFEDKLLANLIGENMIKSQSRSIHHSCSTIIFSPDKRNPRRLILIYLFVLFNRRRHHNWYFISYRRTAAI